MRAPRPGLDPVVIATVASILALVTVLTWISWLVYSHEEGRILDLRAKEAASVVTAAIPSIQTPLASAAELADATGGNATKFDSLVGDYAGRGRAYASMSLWRLSDPAAGPVAHVGTPILASDPAQAAALFSRARSDHDLTLTGILSGPKSAAVGYAYAGSSGLFAAYAESLLPADRHLKIASNSAFSDLNFALYIGASPRPADLLGTTVRLPMTGRHRSVVVPFGDSAFLLIVSAKTPLAGALTQRLPWIVGTVGVLLAIIFGVVTDQLVRRRRRVEALAVSLDHVAEQNRSLYAEQRTIAQRLQHALLPERLPVIEGVSASGRYIPGEAGIDIGGDWYDLMPLDDEKVLFVVGDVSGRGLDAAVTMASLRFALRAYARQGDAPDVILAKLSSLISVSPAGHFATVLCAVLDVPRHSITVANAGHLRPLLAGNGEARFVDGDVGLPVGVTAHPHYSISVIDVPPESTFVGYTDGLIERRGEPITHGLERLRRTASAQRQPVDELIATIIGELVDGGHDDDTAILGIEWVS